MILNGRCKVSRHLDLPKINRSARQFNTTGLTQPVVQVHIAQVKTVHGRRHAGGIRVPVQQVEGGGIAPQQVVVDEEGPYQAVGPQHVEGGRHGGALEIALFVHGFFELANGVLVNEHLQVTDLREVQQAVEEGGALDPVVAPGGQPGEGAAEQGAANAVTDGIQLTLAGGLLNGVHGGDGAFEHVVFKTLVRQFRPGIHPGHHEHGVALRDPIADERLFLTQIENVVLVDPRRNHQQRPAVHGVGGWPVLDELHQFVLENNVARRVGEIVSNRKGVRVGHAKGHWAGALIQITQQVGQTPQQVPAPGTDRGAQHLRVAQDEVTRGQGVGHLAGEKP